MHGIAGRIWAGLRVRLPGVGIIAACYVAQSFDIRNVCGWSLTADWLLRLFLMSPAFVFLVVPNPARPAAAAMVMSVFIVLAHRLNCAPYSGGGAAMGHVPAFLYGIPLSLVAGLVAGAIWTSIRAAVGAATRTEAMTPLAAIPSAEPSIWKGRRGILNTAACCVLGLACALGLWWATERSTIVPGCTAYAHAHGMTYSDFKMVGVRHASTVVCLLRRGDGVTVDVHLSEFVSIFTDLWVSFAMSLEFTVPGFAVLLALARGWLHRKGTRVAA